MTLDPELDWNHPKVKAKEAKKKIAAQRRIITTLTNKVESGEAKGRERKRMERQISEAGNQLAQWEDRLKAIQKEAANYWGGHNEQGRRSGGGRKKAGKGKAVKRKA